MTRLVFVQCMAREAFSACFPGGCLLSIPPVSCSSCKLVVADFDVQFTSESGMYPQLIPRAVDVAEILLNAMLLQNCWLSLEPLGRCSSAE